MRAKLYIVAEELLNHIRLQRSSEKRSLEWLIRALQAYCEICDVSAFLLLQPRQTGDGLPETDKHGSVTLIRPQSRDHGLSFISATANSEAIAGRRSEVISDSAHFLQTLAHSGTRLRSPEKFAGKLQAVLKAHREKITCEPRQKFEGLSQAEVQYWLKAFGEEANE